MTPFSTAFRAATLTLPVLLLTSGAFVSDAAAQARAATRQPTATEATTERLASQMDADATRRALMELLERHPPSVGRVLKLDPSLMRNEATCRRIRRFGSSSRSIRKLP